MGLFDVCNKCGRFRSEHDSPPTDIEVYPVYDGYTMNLYDCLGSGGFEESGDGETILKKVTDIFSEYGLKAELGPKELLSVGCQGDERTRTRFIILSGKLPETKILRELATKISNDVTINRVLYEFAKKD